MEISGTIMYSIGFMIFVIIICFAFYYHSNPTDGAIKIHDLLVELHSIQSLPGDVPSKEHSIHKATKAQVSIHYSTLLSYEVVRGYYDKELAKNGWGFVKEIKVFRWGRDSGNKELVYRKGDYQLIIFYKGNTPDEDYTYYIALNWGESMK